jgi:hypothetical protein
VATGIEFTLLLGRSAGGVGAPEGEGAAFRLRLSAGDETREGLGPGCETGGMVVVAAIETELAASEPSRTEAKTWPQDPSRVPGRDGGMRNPVRGKGASEEAARPSQFGGFGTPQALRKSWAALLMAALGRTC